MGNVLADPFKLLAERHDRNKVCRFEYTCLKRLAAHRILGGRHRRKKVSELKQQDGPDIYVMGSADLLQTLFKNDLVDEMELMTTFRSLLAPENACSPTAPSGVLQGDQSQVAPKGIICSRTNATAM